MYLKKAVPPWRRNSWRKRYSNSIRMQKKAKMAAGAYEGHMIRYMSKCLHSSATAMPAASCAQLLFGSMRNKSKIAHRKFIISPPPLHTFGFQHQVRKPPLNTK